MIGLVLERRTVWMYLDLTMHLLDMMKMSKNILTGLWLALRQWLQIYLTTGNVLKNILSYWVISYGLPGIILGRHASVTGRIIPIRDFRCLPDRE